jgi:CheY-like chemotaxis protein
MAIISIFSGAYCHGEAIAEGLCRRLGWRLVDDARIASAAEGAGLTLGKLESVVYGSPPFFNRLTRAREKGLAQLRLALAEIVQEDDLVYHGFAGLLLPRRLTQVLQVCAIANLDYRLGVARETDDLSPSAARKAIADADTRCRRWTRWILDREPFFSGTYDVVLAMQDMSVDDAIDAVADAAGQPSVRTTAGARRAAADFLLAARVQQALADNGHDVEAEARDGAVEIGIVKPALRMGSLSRKLEDLAAAVPGVSKVSSRPGTRFVPPGLVPTPQLDPPFRTLLVDDEQEFVHTLSERLQARNLVSEVVYDGDQALAALADEPPEVMVLDLKMPGIDGIEVLRRVKRDHPEVEVIILTGHGTDREERLAEELGAFAYLRKPVDIDVLAETMRAAYRRTGGAPPPSRDDTEEV